MSVTSTTQFEIDISDDLMSVRVLLSKDCEPAQIDVAAIESELASCGVILDAEAKQRIAGLPETLEAENRPSAVLLVEGRPAFEGRDGAFEVADELAAVEVGREHLSGQTGGPIHLAQAGDVLGTITAPQSPAAGADVLGREIPCTADPRPVVAGANVTLQPDGLSAVADAAGRVVFSDQSVSVEAITDVAGNVDSKSGNVESDFDVVVRGDVEASCSVTSKGTVYVGGTVDGNVTAGGSLYVRGGILGRDEICIKVGGGLAARMCHSVEIRAGGTLHVANEVFLSTISTQQRIIGPSASIVGGKLYARMGVHAKHLGSDAGVETWVYVGADPHWLTERQNLVREVKETCGRIQRIQETLTLLSANKRSMTAAQREQLTELMCSVDELEMSKKQLDEKLKQLDGRIDACAGAEILAEGGIFPKVIIRIGEREAKITRRLDGPVHIRLGTGANAAYLIAFDGRDKVLGKLPAQRIEQIG